MVLLWFDFYIRGGVSVNLQIMNNVYTHYQLMAAMSENDVRYGIFWLSFEINARRNQIISCRSPSVMQFVFQ